MKGDVRPVTHLDHTDASHEACLTHDHGAGKEAAEGASAPATTIEHDRLAEMEAELSQLREAVGSQRQIGVALGLVAHRYGCTVDQAWQLLTRVSQNTNIKVREIARTLTDCFEQDSRFGPGTLPPDIARFLPGFDNN